ncbi:hypothetical protein, partial [Corticibacter populi]
MSDQDNIPSWLEHLKLLMPPQGALLVGAGTGNDNWIRLFRQWPQLHVTLVEADARQFARLQQSVGLLAHEGNWQLIHGVVAPQHEDTVFYLASNASESGLLPPEALRPFWANLHTQEQQQRPGLSLDELVGREPDIGAPNGSIKPTGEKNTVDWLIIDCLPAGALLRGSHSLDKLDVVVVRAVLDSDNDDAGAEATPHHTAPADTGLSDITKLLNQHGLRLITMEAGRHPAIGHALFVRDSTSALQTQGQALAAAKKLAQEHSQQIEQIKKERDEQAKAANERKAQIEQLTQAKATAEKLAQERDQQIEQIRKERDERAKAANERK